MGYHRTLPRSLVFAPRSMGGIGLSNLQHEMEAQQILILVRHLRARSPLGQAMEVLIRTYQLWAGIHSHILMDTTPCSWIPDQWISRIRRTLRAHQIKIQYDAWTILPLRTHDVYIMEAVNDLGLLPVQLEQINACRMYLQITTLAEMTDHTGCYLLTHALLQPRQQVPTGLGTLSQSTLIWPNISNPTKATWALWTKTLCTLFTGDAAGTKLRRPLGQWTPHYQTNRRWHWRVTPTNQLLHQVSSQTNPKAAVLVRTQRCYLTFSMLIPTNQTLHGTPVTPHDPQCRLVRLPLSAVPHPNTTVPTAAISSLIAQFRAQLNPWQKPLYGAIRKYQKTTSLHDLLVQHSTLTLVSDASVQKNKQSGFAWIITHEERPLWAGVGLAPGHNEDMYSGRAEAFGVFAGLLFFCHYTASFSPASYHGATLQCHCDNQGILTNITEMRTTTSKRPNDTTSDDYDIYAAICHTTAKCTPVRVTLHHVKGHQDKDPKRPLTVVEQLNIDCDTRAKRYTKTARDSSTDYGNPKISSAQPHLIIGNKNICRNVLPALRQAASIPPYQLDLQKKHQWTRGDFDLIQWSILNSSLTAFPTEDQRRLILFIHDHLPLRASKAHPHHGSQLCPSCHRELESPSHFLECNQPERNQLFSNLKQQLTSYTQKLRLHPVIFTVIWLGLASIRANTTYPEITDEIPPTLRAPVEHQTRIGWKNLYFGRVAHSWASAIDTTHPHLTMAGEHIMIQVMKLIWKYFLDLWQLRNTHLHSTGAPLDLPNYKQAAETLYEKRHQISPRAQEALFKTPLQQILDLPPPRLQQWVIRGYRYFTQQLRAEKKQATMATHDIRNYFQPLAQQPDDLQPP